MKLIILALFSVTLAYKVETIFTPCFFVNKNCHTSHAKEVETAIQKGIYISHSTITTKYGMHSMIVYS